MQWGRIKHDIEQQSGQRAFFANLHWGSKDNWFEPDDFNPLAKRGSRNTSDWSEKASRYRGMAVQSMKITYSKDSGKMQTVEVNGEKR